MKRFAQSTTSGPRFVIEPTVRNVANAGRSVHRRGTAMVIVLSLMGALAFLGYFFFLAVMTERDSAEWFAAESKEANPISNADIYFDWALQQLIIGPTNDLQHSALYGRQYSLVPNLIGRLNNNLQPNDTRPYSGRGIAVRFTDADNNGIPDDTSFSFDYNANGINDFDNTNFIFNLSPSSNGGTSPLGASVPTYHPDAGYTYPDINSMFLAHFSMVDINENPAVENLKPVWIPSFHRPQYLPRGSFIADLLTNNVYENKILRPHQNNKDKTNSSVLRYTQSGDTMHNGVDLGEFPFPTTIKEGVWQRAPANLAATFDNADYEYDFDLTGDGVKESIFLDLDFPVTELPDGTKFVPIFSMLVMDADSLINLNTAGNLNGIRNPTNLTNIGYTKSNLDLLSNSSNFVSRSNLGLSVSEINPSRALYADPQNSAYLPSTTPTLDELMDPYQGMFGANLSTTQISMANMEVARLLFGSPNYDSSGRDGDEVTPGRWGEDELVIAALEFGGKFPGPGISLSDDDFDFNDTSIATDDSNTSVYFGGGTARLDPDIGVPIPSYVHPLDFQGMGSSYIASAAGSVRQLGTWNTQNGTDTENPTNWPVYSAKWQYQGNQTIGDVRPYLLSSVPSLQTSPVIYGFVDEVDELIVEPALRDSVIDRVFEASEMAGLHLQQSDYNLLNLNSRLRKLLPFNFGKDNPLSGNIRTQFTTDSWDRMEFSWSRNTLGRSWEFNDTVSFPGKNSFPPVFGAIAPKSVSDPFRPELRDWLAIVLDHQNTAGSIDFIPQRRLNMNKILERDRVSGELEFRNLTPHPVFETADTVTLHNMVFENTPYPSSAGTDPVNNFPNISSNKSVQEWWARYDRQRLARDIYVLLYTLGGGNDALNYTSTNAGNALYTAAQLKEMAQFAVNYVDALDRDNVITKFVYDVNLNDGWNPTEVVTGVETQSLSLSEAVWVVGRRSIASGMDTAKNHQATLYDETEQDHQYLFIELRNSSPFSVPLQDGTWRIRTVKADAMDTPIGSVTFQNHPTSSSFVGSVAPGDNFVIGTHDSNTRVSGGANDGKVRASVFRLDIDVDEDSSYDNRFLPIIPYKPGTAPTNSTEYPGPMVNLDLVHEDHRTQEWFSEHSDPILDTTNKFYSGYLLPYVSAATTDLDVDTGTNIKIILERRQNMTSRLKLDGSEDLDAVNPSDNDNNWIVVDEMEISARTFNLGNQNRTPDFIYNFSTGGGELPNSVFSSERPEPLDLRTLNFNGANPLYRHTLGGPTVTHTDPRPSTQPGASTSLYNQRNSRSPNTNNFWQPHFNRDFSSVFDLLSIPIASFEDDNSAGIINPDTDNMDGWKMAHFKFLNPNNPLDNTPNNDNRWYRILELLEVDSTSHGNIRNDLTMPRLPGKLQLNTIRHPGVLSALIDDDSHLQNFSLLDPLENATVPSVSRRHWEQQFLYSRDGIDPHWRTNGANNFVPLPGTPASRPFLPLSYVDSISNTFANRSVQHTILRKMPHVPGLAGNTTDNARSDANFITAVQANPTAANNHLQDRRTLFEAQTRAGFENHSIDFDSKNRLLKKIHNLTTNRSHVFIVWVGVQFHKAEEDSAGVVRIGEKLTDQPTHRGFFIIDRSKLEDAYDETTQTFDFYQFILSRDTIQ